MDPSDSAYTHINGNDNLFATEAQFLPQNPQSNGLNELNHNTCVADKSELKKILQTVSLLSASKVCNGSLTENVEPRRNNKRKISADCSVSSDSEDIQIVDVVVGVTNPQKNRANELSVMSANTPTRMCSNSSDNLTADFLNVNESNICEVEIMSEVSKKDSSQVSTIVHADNSASTECMSVSTLETDSDLKSNCPETCTVKDTIETIEIKEHEIPSGSAMCDEIVDISNCPETYTVKDTVETIEIKESGIPSNSAMCDEIVDISNCPETYTVKDTVETIEIKESRIPSNSAMCDEIVDISNCPETYTVKDTIETIEIKEIEIPCDITVCGEMVDLSNCPETCNVKDAIETIEIKEIEIPCGGAVCDEMVDLSNCPETFNVKDAIETVEIKENEIPSDSAICDEMVDLSNCPQTCNVKEAIETIEIKENEIPSGSAICDEMVDLSNCPETCNEKDAIETIEIKESEISSDSAMCEEIVDLISCPETCSVKDIVEKTEIKENEILSDTVMCDEFVDLTNETGECSTYDIQYDFNHIPTQITGSWKEFNAGKMNNFTRGCKWAPDGSCILTCSDDNKLRIFNLPAQLWDSSQWCDISELEAVLKIAEGDIIYDYCWYPLMNSNDVSSCCLVSTSRKSTVHLWDGYTGELRCSYRSFNHLDELVTPHSLSFDSDGEKLFCGFQNVIRVFDVNRPGRLFEERPTYSYKTGQCGIISCFAFTSADKNISAAGSYKSTIGLYAEPYGELSCLLEGQANGITQLQFSPDGKYLYSGGRKDPEILCWDLRNLGTVLFSLRRSCVTNQRMYFDISKCGKYVVSGNQNGVITFWDVTKEPKILNETDFSVLIPVQFFLAHDDCVNGISLHPSYPLLCSSSGQRKFPVLMDDDSDAVFSSEVEKQDNSLRLWWIGKLSK